MRQSPFFMQMPSQKWEQSLFSAPQRINNPLDFLLATVRKNAISSDSNPSNMAGMSQTDMCSRVQWIDKISLLLAFPFFLAFSYGNMEFWLLTLVDWYHISNGKILSAKRVLKLLRDCEKISIASILVSKEFLVVVPQAYFCMLNCLGDKVGLGINGWVGIEFTQLWAVKTSAIFASVLQRQQFVDGIDVRRKIEHFPCD